jgi:hypothetical protein
MLSRPLFAERPHPDPPPQGGEGAGSVPCELQAQSFPLGSGLSAVQPVEAKLPLPLAGEGWGGGFFRMRTSNLLDTLMVPAYHFRLDRLLKRMARKNLSA